jgi:two-component system, sensor histidine kinase and response regulator
MKKILVVEDAQALRRDIVEMLSYEGYDVQGAENGLVGVQRARDYQPNLIICDIMMPLMDGFGVLDELRKDRSTAKIPFIFLTARTERNDMRQGMELGANDYLTKPFTANELIKTVQARLSQADIYDEAYGDRIKQLRSNIVLALPHELRTPLNVILGFSDLLMNDSGSLESERVADMARFINNAGLRLNRLNENYLIYAQLELAQTNPDQHQIMRQGVTHHADGIVREQATYWSTHPHPPTDPRIETVTIDAEAVEQLAIAEDYFKKIVEELVDNACKFSKMGTPITVKARREDTMYVLTVTDQGVGMTAEQIDAIGAYMQFDRLMREQQGTGLGLIISKKLVELHEGVFSVASVPNESTTVTVKLPIKQ